MAQAVFRRAKGSQAANTLLLIPFGMAGAALVIRPTRIDIFVFVMGLAAVITLILINNLRPYIRLENEGLFLYLPYSPRPEEHRFDQMLGYRIRGKYRLFIFSLDHRPVRLYLNPPDRESLVRVLQENNIYEANTIP